MAVSVLNDVIERARRLSFVGRRDELRAFDDALDEVLGAPGAVDRVVAFGMGTAQYPLLGPVRENCSPRSPELPLG